MNNASTHFEIKELESGETVINRGDRGDAAYLIRSGEVEVFLETRGQEKILDRLGPGKIFGESALIRRSRRNASVRATKPTSLVVITPPLLEKKLQSSDPTISSLIYMLLERLDQMNKDTLQSL